MMLPILHTRPSSTLLNLGHVFSGPQSAMVWYHPGDQPVLTCHSLCTSLATRSALVTDTILAGNPMGMPGQHMPIVCFF